MIEDFGPFMFIVIISLLNIFIALLLTYVIIYFLFKFIKNKINLWVTVGVLIFISFFKIYAIHHGGGFLSSSDTYRLNIIDLYYDLFCLCV